MSVSSFFLESLGSYLIKRAAQPALDYTLTVLDDELRKLRDHPQPPDWKDGQLTPEQEEFIAMLPALQGDVSVLSHIRSWLRQAPKRGIILLGPSGAGKSQIDLRLRGKQPREDILYTADDENRRLVLQGRRVPLLDTPGDHWHAASSYANVLDALISREPPSVAIIVVAGGYLAYGEPRRPPAPRRSPTTTPPTAPTAWRCRSSAPPSAHRISTRMTCFRCSPTGVVSTPTPRSLLRP